MEEVTSDLTDKEENFDDMKNLIDDIENKIDDKKDKLENVKDEIKEEDEKLSTLKSDREEKETASGGQSNNSDTSDSTDDDDDADKVNINTASREQLEEIPGVGDAISQHIIDYRETNGDFTSIDQLENVEQIGPATMEKIEPHVTE